MAYRITWQQRPNAQGLDGRVAVLGDDGGAGLEVWPALGFNAHRWHIGATELLYADPQLFNGGSPTRSGIPILFPFPNRIRDGTFTWNSKTYQLPLNDPAKKNAIHGFACRHPWRVVDEGANADCAWVTGEFQISRDAPEAVPLWPADGRLRVTYRVQEHALRIEAGVEALAEPLPFGLGYHPYFALSAFGGEQAIVTVPASHFWELSGNLPTGATLPVTGARDLRHGRSLTGLTLDDVLTGWPTNMLGAQSLLGAMGQVRGPASASDLSVLASSALRELVVFTPPHRQAICLEPYTCTTDAIHLGAGWQVLGAHQVWQAVVALQYKAR